MRWRIRILVAVALAAALTAGVVARRDGSPPLRSGVLGASATTTRTELLRQAPHAGWRPERAVLTRTAGLRRGRSALRIRARAARAAPAVRLAEASLPDTLAGDMLEASAWVMSDRARGWICLTLQTPGRPAGGGRSCARAGRTWKRVTATWTARADGAKPALRIDHAEPGATFDVGRVSLSVTSQAEPAAPPPAASAPPAGGRDCDRVASPGGDDAAFGTPAAPYRTVGRLVGGLQPGQTGCLRAGLYVEDVSIRAGGTPGAPITLASFPGEAVTLRGRLVVHDSANDVVVTGLRLNGQNARALPSPTVNGDRVVFLRNDVTNDHTGICFVLGSDSGYGTAGDVVLQENRIHDCGRLPATNHDHGIYVESSRNARILDNVIVDNADRGIQLYPDAQGTLIQRNVIAGNGQGIIFSGDNGTASSGNYVTGNVIADSRLRWNVESYWPPGNPVGTGNVVENNCVWNGRSGAIAEQVGFAAIENRVAEPLFVDRDRGDFRQRAGSPCASGGPSPGTAALVRFVD